MSFTIVARKASQDPLQERLRAHKAEWNKKCSEFIARLNAFKPTLIAFKRGLNGRGDAKAGLPISNIKDPLPTEISGYAGTVHSLFNELASEFASLVSESNNIVQEQVQYSEHRRKPQQRQASQLLDDTLIAEGSNKLTRLWAQLSAVLSSDETKRQRLSMLGLSERLFKNLVNLEDLVLTTNISDMEKVLNSYFLVINNLEALKHDFNKLLKIKNEQIPTVSKTPTNVSAIQQPTTNIAPISKPETNLNKPNIPSPGMKISNMTMHQLFAVVQSMLQMGFTTDDVRIFLDIYHQNKNEKNPNKITLITDRLQDIYRQLFSRLKNQIEQELGQKLPKDISIEELRDLRSNASINDAMMNKLSGNFISRYYNKYKHERSTDPSSASRIEIYNIVRELKLTINTVMDFLEKKNLDITELAAKIADAEKLATKISEPLNHLNMLYKDKYYEPGSKKRQPNVLDPAGRFFNKQIQRDTDRSGW